jgi:3-oxoacyl-[acyl-carrier protein] reductase
MDHLLKNRNAVVTGCNRGIGKSILNVFAKNGANVWACVREENEEFTDYIALLREETGSDIWPVYFDMSETDRVKAGAREILSAKRPVDVVVNNAGVISTSLFQMTPMDKIRDVFDVNYYSQLLLTQNLIKVMTRQKSGSIINVSSSAAIEGNEGRTAYAGSKAALIASTKVLARELARYNIRVNAIAPGLTETDMMSGSTPEDALENTLQRICMQRVGRPEEIANAIMFLASDLSSYMTGQVLRVDGGM